LGKPPKYLKAKGVKRGKAPLFYSSPFPWRGRGTQGDGVTRKNWEMRLK